MFSGSHYRHGGRRKHSLQLTLEYQVIMSREGCGRNGRQICKRQAILNVRDVVDQVKQFMMGNRKKNK